MDLRGWGKNNETGKYEYLDGLYACRRHNASKDQTKPYKASEYWTTDGWKQEEGFSTGACYSRRGIKYPLVQTIAGLPDFSGLYSARLWFCALEMGGGMSWGIAGFRETEPQQVDVNLRSQGKELKRDDVTSMLPGWYDYGTGVYWVKVNSGFVEFGLEDNLLAVYVFGESDQLLYSGEPYIVRVVPFDVPTSMPVLFEAGVEDPEGTYPEYTVPFTPDGIKWSSGSPTPPRTYRLHDEAASTLMTSGTYDTGTNYKSHPVPIKGYREKTLAIRADTASVADGLITQVLTQNGNWRTIDTYDLGANEFYYLDINVDFPLLRIGYEPSADGASITDAEVNLR